MTTVERAGTASSPRTGIEIAGTVWPLYKLEALAGALVVLLFALLATQSAQVAVLGGAAAGTVVWVLGLLRERRAPTPSRAAPNT
ncbi:hypothetical protein OG921_22910 [Aldersonia sp. NBC_00410]|uniref:hypothetical protein n=1 Tax=Aldersonia sp. NBC_00410 TaxID=2975954 RepID=UPI00224DD675|nr:hypothetical protein [Aldersonia sp. NBC_00410]MCX5046026.1 hypothetical protein [Aldersonia sp. NBC_00410]